ncbi:hypothetical protein KSC_024740 [Ktedonobacter sp. SOSP1-52]|uniref:hypothetical protein n=1 Tax=Ktedonobacter sp. SOSP1-52 TaxID=2778366 RepID=UPI00191696F1|nr:hypothetical protein [Ktedonobacter sp. SOSP1-52]GHO63582.1 hypothetical protein KSC_024740 [Ktedonobacter sp. SOSP1-52]
MSSYRPQGVTFVARRVAPGKIMYQLAALYRSRHGVEQMHTLFPDQLVSGDVVRQLGYSTEHIHARRGW